MDITLYIIEIFVGVIFSFFGFVIWYYDAIDILSGYDASKTIEKHGLAKWVGSNLIILGVILILISLISIYYLNGPNSVLSFVLISFLLIIRIVLGCKKFEV